MAETEDKTICPYCGKRMCKWEVPLMSTWSASYFYVCFNDECSYYVKGWSHMTKTTSVGCSYRHKYDPETGSCGPLPVWSPDAGKDRIIHEE
ncbi:MAG: ogr/Delta-like zinc finger family protein [Syntrophobacteraceae bacterium]|jgi:hypothetical protein